MRALTISPDDHRAAARDAVVNYVATASGRNELPDGLTKRDYRNAIIAMVDGLECTGVRQFDKNSLRQLADALGADPIEVETCQTLRAAILRKCGVQYDDPDEYATAFLKPELKAVARELALRDYDRRGRVLCEHRQETDDTAGLTRERIAGWGKQAVNLIPLTVTGVVGVAVINELSSSIGTPERLGAPLEVGAVTVGLMLAVLLLVAWAATTLPPMGRAAP